MPKPRKTPAALTLPSTARRIEGPLTLKPALATLVAEAPEHGDGLSEVKWDGYRMLISGETGAVRVFSRNGLDWTLRLPTLVTELAWLVDRRAVLDGEIVALREDGVSSFENLKAALGDKQTNDLFFMAFDLVVLDGHDIRPCRQDERSQLLEKVLKPHSTDHVRLSETFDGAFALFEAACQEGLEGIIIKSAAAPYRAGRSDSWRKLKCGGHQEFAVVGVSDPEGSRQGFGASLLGYRDEMGRFTYCGRVGTGFDRAFLSSFRQSLDTIEQMKPTVTLPKGLTSRGVHWVEPHYVGEVRFTEWSKDGILRHLSFLGLREDKKAEDVVREQPAEASAVPWKSRHTTSTA